MRFLLSAVVGLIVVLVAAVLVAPSFIDWNQYKDEITRRAESLTGRELVIGGNVEIALLPAPALVARDVRLANVDGGTAADMIRLAVLEARVALGPLVAGNIQVETVKLVEPVFELEILADGRKNWEFPRPATPAAQPSEVTDGTPDAAGDAADEGTEANMRLDNFVVEEGTVVYRDQTTGRVERLDGINARFAAASLSGPFESAGEIVLHGIPLGFEATVGRVIHGRTVPLDVSLTTASGATEVRLSGTAVGLATTPKFKGTLKGSGANLAEFARLAAGDGRLPGFFAQAFGFESEVVASAEQVDVQNLVLSLGETRANGEVTMTFAEGATFAAKLGARHVNMDEWLAMPQAASADKPAPASETAGGQRDDGGPRASIKLAPAPAPAPPAEEQPFALPAGLSGTLDVSVDAITYRAGIVRKLRAAAELAGGEITVSHVSAQLPGSSEAAVFGFVTVDEGRTTFEGEVEASVSDLRRVLVWLGVGAPDAPSDRLRKLSLKSGVSVTPEDVRITDLDLTLDNSRLTGAVTVALRARPAFGADLSVDKISLDSYRTDGEAESGSAPSQEDAKSATVEPGPARGAALDAGGEAPYPVLGVLERFDANLKLHVGSVVVQSTAFKDIRFDGTLVDGRLEVRRASIADAAGASAMLSGTFAGFSGVPEFSNAHVEAKAANVARLLRLGRVESPVPPAKLGPVTVVASIDGSLLESAVEVRVTAAGGAASVSGRPSLLDLLTGVTFDVKADHPDLKALLGRLDADYRPVGAVGAVALEAGVELGSQSLRLRELKAAVGAVVVEGSADLAWDGARPHVSAELRAGEIVVDPFLPAVRAARVRSPLRTGFGGLVPAAFGPRRANGHSGLLRRIAAETGGGRWPTEAIDLEALGRADGTLRLIARSVDYGRYLLRDVSVNATLQAGVLDVESLSGTLFGGAFQARGVVRTQPEGAPPNALEVDVAIANADVREALSAVAGKPAASGTMNVDAKLRTAGASVADLVSALDGTASLSLSRLDVNEASQGTAMAAALGLVQGLNQLGGVLGGGTENGLADINGNFQIAGGRARSDDLRLSSNLGIGEAAGTVDLAGWGIDVTGKVTLAENLITQLLARKSGARQVVPFEIRGPLDAPNVKLGLGGEPSGAAPKTGIKPLDKVLETPGIGSVLQRVLPGLTGAPSAPASPPPTAGTAAPERGGELPPPPPPPGGETVPRPEDILKRLFDRVR
ncbi:MAG: AsmA family protein [Rhodospirillales bacterium]|nr:AsmA family protein [Rhodospirillales bacterium]